MPDTGILRRLPSGAYTAVPGENVGWLGGAIRRAGRGSGNWSGRSRIRVAFYAAVTGRTTGIASKPPHPHPPACSPFPFPLASCSSWTACPVEDFGTRANLAEATKRRGSRALGRGEKDDIREEVDRDEEIRVG